ncbi:MdtA/MuxA family multidrug efflux RND transporter periplasmic adaptor subunit [Stutzerimonas stutzeri]|uniref:MdtA/MuxA family multidrug efflux RND transporter periplasmic adaptor subunit n=1 Tax=Stutzerimonas stutzeri TaxID=316 RepID=UPI0026589E81|nr:MdtA/MuxA family multidrug efflux RND transporter periplasmic adaptor subunit [Stutzerimonas stutzeri]MCF6780785.1 MdtA/MuxA family multidrug efflux RND transporter periplasmic adaptor subunit [Stutzerimonas stutzeri]MCF6803355.1 MdtA/MuxA family multidrug efflux RND transporter periplasmic adaptor subunit [Stutzerimonas stutzeri]
MSEANNFSSGSLRRGLVIFLVLAAAVLLVWWFWPSADEQPQRPSGPRGMFGGPTPVRVAPAEQGRFEVYVKALGTVTPLNTVNVRSRVAGELMEIHFDEGQRVKAGDLLAVIDPRPYKIALQQAEGTLQQNRALLQNAEVDLKRYQGLYDDDSIAKQTLDTQRALVSQYQGTLAANQAAVNEARLNLQFTEIRAPIDGRVGLRQLDLGNLVAANDATPLVVITQTQPMAISFTLPEGELPPVLSRFRRGEELAVQAWDRGERMLFGEGVLESLDNQIDTTTGTLKLKARFDNEAELLIPNQFVNVRLRVETLQDATLIPSEALQFGSRGHFAYVVGEDNKVQLRILEVGPSNGEHTVILAGLAEGERVVLEGTDRLRDGAEVEVVDRHKLAEEAAENPVIETQGGHGRPAR